MNTTGHRKASAKHYFGYITPACVRAARDVSLFFIKEFQMTKTEDRLAAELCIIGIRDFLRDLEHNVNLCDAVNTLIFSYSKENNPYVTEQFVTDSMVDSVLSHFASCEYIKPVDFFDKEFLPPDIYRRVETDSRNAYRLNKHYQQDFDSKDDLFESVAQAIYLNSVYRCGNYKNFNHIVNAMIRFLNGGTFRRPYAIMYEGRS